MKEQKNQNKRLHELNCNELKSYNGGGESLWEKVTEAIGYSFGWHIKVNGGEYLDRARR